MKNEKILIIGGGVIGLGYRVAACKSGCRCHHL